jgi:hypothetical protein
MDARVPVLVEIDHAGAWSANAVGRGNSIFFRVIGEKIPDFMKQITFGSILQVAFPSGNEQSWSGRLTGSGGAAAALLRCIKQVKALEQPTQPYSTQPVQPIAPPQPTQPFTGVVNPAQRGPTLERRT